MNSFYHEQLNRFVNVESNCDLEAYQLVDLPLLKQIEKAPQTNCFTETANQPSIQLGTIDKDSEDSCDVKTFSREALSQLFIQDNSSCSNNTVNQSSNSPEDYSMRGVIMQKYPCIEDLYFQPNSCHALSLEQLQLTVVEYQFFMNIYNNGLAKLTSSNHPDKKQNESKSYSVHDENIYRLLRQFYASFFDVYGLLKFIDSNSDDLNPKNTKLGIWNNDFAKNFICTGVYNGEEISFYTTWLNNQQNASDQIRALDEMFPTPFYDEQHLNMPFSRIMANPQLISVLSNPTFFVLKNRYGVNLTDANFSKDKSECTITLLCEEKDRICPNRDKCSCFKDKTCPGLLKMNGDRNKSIIDYDGNSIYTLNIKFKNLIRPKKCSFSNEPIQPVLNDVIFPSGRVSWTLVSSVLNDFSLMPETNVKSLSTRYLTSFKFLQELTYTHLLCKRYYSNITPPKRLVIDEFLGGDDYMTIAIDPDKQQVVSMVEGKQIPKLLALFSHLKSVGTQIEVLASDDNASFRKYCAEVLGDNFIWSLDPFHLLKKFSTEVYTPIINGVKTRDLKLFKGENVEKYWFMALEEHLNSFSSLTKATDKLAINLKYCFSMNDIIKDADLPEESRRYIMEHPILPELIKCRELLNKVVKSTTVEMANEHLTQLKQLLLTTYEKQPKYLGKLKTFAEYLTKKADGILGYITTKLTSSIIEGYNSKIKLIKRSMRGFKKPLYFMLRTMFSFHI